MAISFFSAFRLDRLVVALVFVATGVGEAAGSGVLVEAHRGDSINTPENTIASIDLAIGIADLTEFDVRITADGELVLMHDSTVNRTTNGSGAVSSLTLAQIKTLDAGSWFSPAFAGEQVPTMAEAINAALLGGITPLVEPKTGSALDYYNEFVSLGLSPSDFRVISFDWNFLSDLNALDPSYNLGALGSGTLDQSTIDTIQANGADFISWAHPTINQSVVDLVQSNGMEIHTWTVNSPSRMQELIDFGVDGITTDRPQVLRDLVIESSRTADINGDGFVDAADWLLYNTGRGVDMSGLSLSEAMAMGDIDGDLDNDIADFVLFKTLYEEANGMGLSTLFTNVPEPATVTLSILALGLTMMARPTMARSSRRQTRTKLRLT